MKSTVTALRPAVPSVPAATRLMFSPRDRALERGVEPAGQPLVADSWLVADGRARALLLHEQRFRESCARMAPDLDTGTVSAFLRSVRPVLPRTGRWFPRIELRSAQAPELAVWLRPAPEPAANTVLWISPTPDPRCQPQVKGPDLAVLASLRDTARVEGADDAVLRHGDGSVLEAAHSALVWWRRDVLCMPADESRTLPSITRRLVVDLAERRGIGVIREQMRPDEFDAVETWTLNALHGIRSVTGWITATGLSKSQPVQPSRVAEWSSALQELMVALDDLPIE